MKLRLELFSHSDVSDSATSWTACSIPGFPALHCLPELTQTHFVESVLPSSHVILCCPLLLLPSIFPSIRVFSSEQALCIRWPKYWCFSFSISPSNKHSGLISFRIDWFDLLAVQGTLKSLLQYHSWKNQFFSAQYFFRDTAKCLSHESEEQVGGLWLQGPGRERGLPWFRGSLPSLLAHRRLEQNFFNCSCDIRWMQLWQEQGEAKLNSQNLYCIGADGSQLPLFRMNISQCGEWGPRPGWLHARLSQTPGRVRHVSRGSQGFPSPLPCQPWILRIGCGSGSPVTSCLLLSLHEPAVGRLVSGSGSQSFWRRGLVSWKTVFPWTEGGGWHGLGMIQVHYIYCTLYSYFYYISSTSDHQALGSGGWGLLVSGMQKRVTCALFVIRPESLHPASFLLSKPEGVQVQVWSPGLPYQERLRDF